MCVCRTSIHIAAKHGHLDILKCMLKDMKPEALLAAVNSADNHGLTPLFLASQRCDSCFGRLPVLQLFHTFT